MFYKMKAGVERDERGAAMMHEEIEPAIRRWCVLRTSPGRTLTLAQSLASVGFDVWTPAETQERRRPRSKATLEIDMPILPTFVFARADRIADLQFIHELPISPHPPFSIFRHAGRVPLVSERDIVGLRTAEEVGRVKKLKKQRHRFDIGSSVRVDAKSFGGMTGVVETSDGKQALVSFGGSFKVKIDAWLLHANDVEALQL